MANNTAPPVIDPSKMGTQTLEQKLFKGLAEIKMFPVDPNGPGEPPARMLPAQSFLPRPMNNASSYPKGIGPIDQAMMSHPPLTRAVAEEMARDLGFL